MASQRMLLVVVADGEHARFLRYAEGTLRAERSFDSSLAHRRSAALASDRPGAAFHSRASAHHAREPRSSPQTRAKEAFAKLVAGEIDATFESGDYEGVILVAPAHAMNAIRAALSELTNARITRVLRKDLIKVPDEALINHLPIGRSARP